MWVWAGDCRFVVLRIVGWVNAVCVYWLVGVIVFLTWFTLFGLVWRCGLLWVRVSGLVGVDWCCLYLLFALYGKFVVWVLLIVLGACIACLVGSWFADLVLVVGN